MNQQSCVFGESGEVLRDEGMQQAIDHAEQEVPNWADLTYQKLNQFVTEYPYLEFMTEDFRKWAYHRGLPEPPHSRAFGGIMARAGKRGLIVKVRISQVKNPTAHCANANVWRRA